MNAFLHQIPKLPQVAGKYWFYKFALMSPLLINHKHFLGKYFVFPKSTLGSATLLCLRNKQLTSDLTSQTLIYGGFGWSVLAAAVAMTS